MAAFRAAAAAALLVALACLVMEARAQTCPGATSYQSCLSAVTTVNTMPTKACCAKVQQTLLIAKVGLKCLCDAMTSATAKAFKVIKSQAILLPGKCQRLMGLKYVKGYNCTGSIIP